jgi:carboxypeptidase Taq
VSLKRREAEAVGIGDEPYDALLDEYEPGATAAEITEVFAALRDDLVPLVQAILGSGKKAPHDVLERDYPVERQRAFGEGAAKAIGFDFTAGRLDVTTHPFCSGIGPGDCRITTRYNPRHFNESFFGILHEAGHAIYEQGLAAEHFGTPLGSACSLGIHESQSRLWENLVGRSLPFWRRYTPVMHEVFGERMGSATVEQVYRQVNRVTPSLIRVEADEVTYNMHILVRFELELALLRGELSAADLPAAWNEAYRRRLGVTPPHDGDGVLQDVHWSSGAFGYFPTYTIGNLYSALLWERILADLPDVYAQIEAGEFAPLLGWLREQIHRPGYLLDGEELIKRVTGSGLAHQPFMAYLWAKYGELYGVRPAGENA